MKEWLIHFPSSQTSSTKIRLVCFPFAGGGTLNYSKWRKDLDAHIELYAINLPGRERFFSKPCLTNYQDLIVQLASILHEAQDTPMIFFGHSFGGLTAYLIALELQRLGKSNKDSLISPLHLFISARLPPRPNYQPYENLAHLNPEIFQKIVIERFQGIPQAIQDNPELLNIFIPIIQNDFKMYEQYPSVMRLYNDQAVPCKITTIGFSEDNTEETDFLKWGDFTKRGHHHIQFSGGHFEIINHWKPVTDYINQFIYTLI